MHVCICEVTSAAVATFSPFQIDVSDYISLPEDLREIPEMCFSEDASPDTLNL